MVRINLGRHSTANAVLWCLKECWLRGDSIRQQREVHGMVADWLAEAGRGEESVYLRGDSWWLVYWPGEDCYRVQPMPASMLSPQCWPVHWWPCAPVPADPRRRAE